MGENIGRSDILDTPRRFAKALLSFSPNKKEPQITVFDTQSTGIVIVKNLEVRSLCQHHLFPFFGKGSVAYVPNGKIAGLSKFQRVMDFVAEKPQDQERLTKEFLDFLVDRIQPKYMIVKLECEHTCMKVRGVKCTDANTITIDSFGVEQDNPIFQNILNLL